MFCISCGKGNPDDATFCYSCGSRLYRADSVREPQESRTSSTAQLQNDVAPAAAAKHPDLQLYQVPEHKPHIARRRRRNTLITVFSTVALIAGVALYALYWSLDRRPTHPHPVERVAQMERAPEQPSSSASRGSGLGFNPNAISDWAVMKRGAPATEGDESGLSADQKQRMRELLALALKGGLGAQQNPIQVNLSGEKHDVLEFRWPQMTAALQGELIREFETADTNFWNAMRLLDFEGVAFVGETYRKQLSKMDFIRYSKGYDKYRREFAKVAAGLAAGAKRELKQSEGNR